MKLKNFNFEWSNTSIYEDDEEAKIQGYKMQKLIEYRADINIYCSIRGEGTGEELYKALVKELQKILIGK